MPAPLLYDSGRRHPEGAEIAIYQSPIRSLEYRIIVGLTDPQWTAQRLVSFAGAAESALDPASVMFSPMGGGPRVDGSGNLMRRGYGQVPWEWVSSRRLNFPNDESKPFAVEASIKFPVADPIYPQVFVVQGVETRDQQSGPAALLVQQGSAYSIGDHIGKIALWGSGYPDGSAPWFEIANDMAAHELRVEWDPAQSLCTLRWDGTVIHESDNYPYEVSPPRMWGIGSLVENPRKLIEAAGGHAANALVDGYGYNANPALINNAPLMLVDYVSVEEFGSGYEAEAWPGWTDANSGGTTFDNADPAERVSIDGVTWAILPSWVVANLNCGGPSREGAATLNLELTTLGNTGVDRFQASERWVGRPIIIDTRMTDEVLGSTSWKRLGMYTVQNFSLNGTTLSLTGTDRVMARMDTPLPYSWEGEDPEAGVSVGSLLAVRRGLNLTEIGEDVVAVVDAWAGGPLGATSTQIQMPGFIPRVLDNPGISMLEWYLSLCDRLVQETWVNYRTSGAMRYGQLWTNLWGDGSLTLPSWTFYGKGGAGPADIVPPGPHLHGTGRQPGMVHYRPNNPLEEIAPEGYIQNDLTRSLYDTNLTATFPMVPYPDNGAVLEDSMAELSRAFEISPLIPWPDVNGDPHVGSIAYPRYLQTRQASRTIEFDVFNHDWFEVGEVIAIDDPDGRGITDDETWVISSVGYRIGKEGFLRASLNCHTAHIYKATDIFS